MVLMKQKRIYIDMTGKGCQLRTTEIPAPLLRETMTAIAYQLIDFSWNVGLFY